MNCDKAKKIKIEDFLNSLGLKPVRTYGDFLWYNSPFRKDKNPSFKVDRRKNLWYDVGTGAGGNIIDLVMQINGCSISGALMILQKPELSTQSFSFSEQQKESLAGIEIKHVQPLQNRALLQYLEKRNIPAKIALKYVMEAYYRVRDKQYFALAFKNDKGGYELRNEYFKGGNSPKYISTIPGNNRTINIFEGFMDFLSALVFMGTSQPGNKTIILNSTENLAYALPYLQNAHRINSYLDNDRAGENALARIIAINPNVVNQAKIIYPDQKDFNEYLTNK